MTLVGDGINFPHFLLHALIGSLIIIQKMKKVTFYRLLGWPGSLGSVERIHCSFRTSVVGLPTASIKWPGDRIPIF